jgi:hypothetical protein
MTGSLTDNLTLYLLDVYAVPQLRRLVSGFPAGFEPRSGHVGLLVDKVALGQVFSDYFGFPCQFSFHRLFHIHRHLSSGAGTIGELVAHVPSGFSLTPPHETKEKTTGCVFKRIRKDEIMSVFLNLFNNSVIASKEQRPWWWIVIK